MELIVNDAFGEVFHLWKTADESTGIKTNSNDQETYVGLTEKEFKTRFNLNKSSLKLEHK